VSRRVVFSSGTSLDEAIKELKRLGGPPGFKVVNALEAVLQAAFLETQAATHIITGSLKASGRTSSDTSDAWVWEGEISYGGPLYRAPAPGPPNDPVDYAIYEMARGGDHDFFAALPGFDDAWVHAIDMHFEGLL
jgi:hypothetical protein